MAPSITVIRATQGETVGPYTDTRTAGRPRRPRGGSARLPRGRSPRTDHGRPAPDARTTGQPRTNARRASPGPPHGGRRPTRTRTTRPQHRNVTHTEGVPAARATTATQLQGRSRSSPSRGVAAPYVGQLYSAAPGGVDPNPASQFRHPTASKRLPATPAVETDRAAGLGTAEGTAPQGTTPRQTTCAPTRGTGRGTRAYGPGVSGPCRPDACCRRRRRPRRAGRGPSPPTGSTGRCPSAACRCSSPP